MNIDRTEVITIRMISASATPTILRRIDWLNSENDFTTPRMDCGDAGEAVPSCSNDEPLRDRSKQPDLRRAPAAINQRAGQMCRARHGAVMSLNSRPGPGGGAIPTGS